MSSRPQSQRDPAPVPKEALPFVEKFAVLLNNAGLGRMPARVFAATLASAHGRLTAAELAETLQISPAAVSGAVRYLVQVGFLQRGREPGARRDHFAFDVGWYEIVSQKDSTYRDLAQAIDEGAAAVGPETEVGRRLAETRDFFEYLAKEMPLLLARWREQAIERRSEAS
ncbi:MarR family transcriptional regulator [Amycolatopsis sp. K13G38]|uniref:MarR family transcriptional regulator n=1 Tax=Amycolatopsis acididurans TaxID=2724524 RepID=A0ABX1J561_9PSEU|nr:MarR family transcriptional regulator [Amycolatopsis acididurans]NKQ54947.1 MarR family transcriptional regulator [Amycolatopsis acididurans]